jgi:hypothetical protein
VLVGDFFRLCVFLFGSCFFLVLFLCFFTKTTKTLNPLNPNPKPRSNPKLLQNPKL